MCTRCRFQKTTPGNRDINAIRLRRRECSVCIDLGSRWHATMLCVGRSVAPRTGHVFAFDPYSPAMRGSTELSPGVLAAKNRKYLLKRLRRTRRAWSRYVSVTIHGDSFDMSIQAGAARVPIKWFHPRSVDPICLGLIAGKIEGVFADRISGIEISAICAVHTFKNVVPGS